MPTPLSVRMYRKSHRLIRQYASPDPPQPAARIRDKIDVMLSLFANVR